MVFTVSTADQVETNYEGVYKLEPSGVLAIYPDDEQAPLVKLSPAFWQQIVESRADYSILSSVH